MMHKPLAVGAASAALLLALTACGDSGTERTAETTSAAASTSSVQAQDAAHNDADVTFAQMMIPHHTQAVEMSEVLLAKNDIDPRVTALAEQIKAAQSPEIEQLTGWLKDWDQPTSMPMTSMPMTSMPMGTMPMPMPMTSMPMPMPMPMPMTSMPMGTMPMPMPMTSMPMPMPMGTPGMEGMMSEQDMQALMDAQGTEAARLFLTQMIAHHRGAIIMAQTEVDTGVYPPAVQLAQTIVDTQQQEIATMEQLLSSL